MTTPVNIDNIPQELKDCSQWVMWKLENKPGQEKPAKILYTVNNTRANTTDPKTWNTFEACVKSTETNLFSGIGFVFSYYDDYVGYDLDNVLDPETGQMDQEVAQEIKSLDSYTEISQSGKGVHVIFKGKKPGDRCRSGFREMYDKDRFFVMTGNHLEGTPQTINKATPAAIKAIYDKIDPPRNSASENTAHQEHPRTSSELTDEEVISLCMSARNADKFESLWDGKTSAYGGDSSRADQALCDILAFYTQDPEQIDRIFRESKLCRDKWEDREDYRGRTIKKAIDDLKEVYTPPGGRGIETEFDPKNHLAIMFFGGEKGKTFLIKELGEYILKQIPCKALKDTGELLYYDKGVYRRGGETIVGQMVQNILGNRSRKTYQSEVINWVKHATYLDRHDFNPARRLNFLNGVLDLYTGELLPHSHDVLFTVQHPVNYDPKATCPRIEQFLCEILDPDKAATICEFVGYSLTTEMNIQKAVIVYGAAGAGKSTLLNLCTQLVGQENVSNESLHSLENDRFAVYNLCHKTLNVFPDLPDRPLSDIPIFKQIVGGDRMRAEAKYLPAFSFGPTVKMLFSANALPPIKNLDDAKSRRLVLIKIKGPVPTKKQNKHLIDELTASEELSGFLNLVLKGLKRLTDKGAYSYDMPTESIKIEYMAKSDPVAAFTKECLVFSATHYIKKSEMYEAFCIWCKYRDVEKLTEKRLSRQLSKMNYSYDKETTGPRERYWCECEFSDQYHTIRESVQYMDTKLDGKKQEQDAHPGNLTPFLLYCNREEKEENSIKYNTIGENALKLPGLEGKPIQETRPNSVQFETLSLDKLDGSCIDCGSSPAPHQSEAGYGRSTYIVHRCHACHQKYVNQAPEHSDQSEPVEVPL
jgi:putative DNA primase/helicase